MSKADNNELRKRVKQEEEACRKTQASLNESIDSLMEEREAAKEVIEQSCELIDSLKKTPSDIKVQIREIAKAQKTFNKADELAQKQFKREAVGKGAAVAAVGAIGALAWNLRDSVKEAFKNKNLLMVVIIGILAIAVSLAALIVSLFRKKKAVEWSGLLKQYQDEHAQLHIQIAEAESARKKIQTERMGLCDYLEKLSGFRGANFKKLEISQQQSLYALVNNTLALAEMVGKVD